MHDTGLAAQLEALVPAIAARRDDIERDRRLPRDLVATLRETGLFTLEIPRALGGSQAAPVEILRAIETVSRADGSTGWCAAVAIANNGVVGFMHGAGAREVFADPTAPTAGVFAPSGTAVRGAGGFRVSGRWHFASGITHCDWVWAGCVVTENGRPRMTPAGPEIVHAFMPRSAVEVHDTWFVSGLCGTGSHDITARDVLVPSERVFAIGAATRERPEPLYRMPVVGWFVSHVAAVGLGVARAALDELVALAQSKVPTFSTAVLADRPAAQLELARAEAALAAARAFLHDSIEDLWRTIGAGGQPAPREIALNRVAAANAAEVGAAVSRTASVLAGGGSIFTTSALQRHVRDADAIAHHFTVAPHVWEDAGRVFMGRAPSAPMF
jgi:alkylation response protein AidB-like acyl-CoA dehydrogenase